MIRKLLVAAALAVLALLAPLALAQPQQPAFDLVIQAPDGLRQLLESHLELGRYRQVEDLDDAEIARLIVLAEKDARELLATQGYFSPEVRIAREPGPRPRLVVTVEPGQPTVVGAVDLGFEGDIATSTDSDAVRQREGIRAAWELPVGQTFTQGRWDAAKIDATRRLVARRYPAGRIGYSLADVDAASRQARLGLRLDSGALFRLGELRVTGAERYDPLLVERLARLPRGMVYDQEKIVQAQLRLVGSGYYESAFLFVDPEADPAAAPVQVTVREAPLQKVVFGLGFTSDSGPRVSLDHIHNQMPLLGWRAVSRFSYDKNTHLLNTEWSALPRESGWRWFHSAQLQRENNAGSYTVDSARVRSGQNKSGDHIDRSVFLQYDYSVSEGIDPPPSASSLSLNWGWTGRYFDSPSSPTRGNGLALEIGVGYTLLGERLPYLRTDGRWLGILPIGSADTPSGAARRPRLALRAEAGAVTAKEQAQIPQTQLFLTGGDTTVRGYSYRQIGVVTDQNQIVAGRYLAVASIEWQQPIVLDGKLSDYEGVVFVDGGSVADKPRDLKLKLGVGAGVRWRSPVGPLQADIAYGVDVSDFRLHLRFGFTF